MYYSEYSTSKKLMSHACTHRHVALPKSFSHQEEVLLWKVMDTVVCPSKSKSLSTAVQAASGRRTAAVRPLPSSVRAKVTFRVKISHATLCAKDAAMRRGV